MATGQTFSLDPRRHWLWFCSPIVAVGKTLYSLSTVSSPHLWSGHPSCPCDFVNNHSENAHCVWGQATGRHSVWEEFAVSDLGSNDWGSQCHGPPYARHRAPHGDARWQQGCGHWDMSRLPLLKIGPLRRSPIFLTPLGRKIISTDSAVFPPVLVHARDLAGRLGTVAVASFKVMWGQGRSAVMWDWRAGDRRPGPEWWTKCSATKIILSLQSDRLLSSSTYCFLGSDPNQDDGFWVSHITSKGPKWKSTEWLPWASFYLEPFRSGGSACLPGGTEARRLGERLGSKEAEI
jgi:hypothetical protein